MLQGRAAAPRDAHGAPREHTKQLSRAKDDLARRRGCGDGATVARNRWLPRRAVTRRTAAPAALHRVLLSVRDRPTEVEPGGGSAQRQHGAPSACRISRASRPRGSGRPRPTLLSDVTAVTGIDHSGVCVDIHVPSMALSAHKGTANKAFAPRRGDTRSVSWPITCRGRRRTGTSRCRRRRAPTSCRATSRSAPAGRSRA